nr:retrotransposon-related protein [Tanacetum cinerariifolium]
MQGLALEVDLYVLPKKRPDAVLGIQWLQKLGKVTHDYVEQTMEFILEGATHTLWDPRIKIFLDDTLRESDRDTEDALSKLRQMGTMAEYEREAFFRARITEAYFKDENNQEVDTIVCDKEDHDIKDEQVKKVDDREIENIKDKEGKNVEDQQDSEGDDDTNNDDRKTEEGYCVMSKAAEGERGKRVLAAAMEDGTALFLEP